HVAAGTEVHVLALGQTQRKLLDEGGHVGVGLDGALPLLDPEHLLRNPNLHVLLDRSLTGQAPAFTGLALVEVRLLGSQHTAATALDVALGLSTGPATSSGRREEDAIVGEGTQQLAASRDCDGPLPVDFNTHITAGDQAGSCEKND